MSKYQYTIGTRLISICDANEEGYYNVIWEQQHVGYIYVSELNDDTGRPIWNGNTPYLNLIAPEIGLYIEEVDMSYTVIFMINTHQ